MWFNSLGFHSLNNPQYTAKPVVYPEQQACLAEIFYIFIPLQMIFVHILLNVVHGVSFCIYFT